MSFSKMLEKASLSFFQRKKQQVLAFKKEETSSISFSNNFGKLLFECSFPENDIKHLFKTTLS